MTPQAAKKKQTELRAVIARLAPPGDNPLRDAMRTIGIPYRLMARQMGISPTQLARWLWGSGKPNAKSRAKITSYLERKIAELQVHTGE